MRVGFLGAGGIARAHATAFRQVDDMELAAVYDPDRRAASGLVDIYGGAVCESQKELVDAVDVVYVLTPPKVHRDGVLAAVEAGKAVLCEKPIATTLEDARAMVEAAGSGNVPFAMGFNNRFRPQVRRVREAVLDGQVGEVLSCWSRRMGYSRLEPGSNWRTSEGELAGMTIQSISHDIDMLRYMVGEVTVVSGLVTSSLPEVRGYDDNLSATLAFEEGAVGNIQASWSSHLGHGSRGVVGSKGSISVEGPDLWTMTHVWHSHATDRSEQVDKYSPKVADDKGYVAEAASFARTLSDGSAPEATGYDGLRALEVSLALLESSRTRTWVDSRQLA